MARSRHLLAPGVVLDARRAVWLEESGTLAVADLHLGFLWAQRARGSMFPLGVKDDALARLESLLADYPAAELVVLGDIVHRAVPLEPVREELRGLCRTLEGRATLRLLGGNHDRGLPELLAECDLAVQVEAEYRVGESLLVHGDVAPLGLGVTPAPQRVFMGHEHPAVRIGDGIASMKCPAFLVAPGLVVLPAFSSWAAGTNVRAPGEFMSPLAKGAKFTHAVAVMGAKLLPVPLR